MDGDNGWLADKFRTWSTSVNFCSENVEISEEIGDVAEQTGVSFRQAFDDLSHKLRTDQTLNISHHQKRQLERLDQGAPEFEANAKRLLGTIRSEFRSLIDMNVFKDWLKASEGLN